MICDRCRREANRLTHVADLRQRICDGCLEAWRVLNEFTPWGDESKVPKPGEDQ